MNHISKRLFDVSVSFIGMLVLAPLFLLAALAVKTSSPGPLFFLQIRIGRNGRFFKICKFRTMVMDSERHGTITTGTDSRITPVGRILRRLKLDEYPQLWNVLIGNMSFVGPRPDVPGYADKLDGHSRKILSLRPGITSPASIFFRNEEELLAKVADPQYVNDHVIWPKKVELNLEYLEKWSFWRDVGFIVITVAPAINGWLKLVPVSDSFEGDIVAKYGKKVE